MRLPKIFKGISDVFLCKMAYIITHPSPHSSLKQKENEIILSDNIFLNGLGG